MTPADRAVTVSCACGGPTGVALRYVHEPIRVCNDPHGETTIRASWDLLTVDAVATCTACGATSAPLPLVPPRLATELAYQQAKSRWPHTGELDLPATAHLDRVNDATRKAPWTAGHRGDTR